MWWLLTFDLVFDVRCLCFIIYYIIYYYILHIYLYYYILYYTLPYSDLLYSLPHHLPFPSSLPPSPPFLLQSSSDLPSFSSSSSILFIFLSFHHSPLPPSLLLFPIPILLFYHPSSLPFLPIYPHPIFFRSPLPILSPHLTIGVVELCFEWEDDWKIFWPRMFYRSGWLRCVGLISVVFVWAGVWLRFMFWADVDVWCLCYYILLYYTYTIILLLYYIIYYIIYYTYIISYLILYSPFPSLLFLPFLYTLLFSLLLSSSFPIFFPSVPLLPHPSSSPLFLTSFTILSSPHLIHSIRVGVYCWILISPHLPIIQNWPRTN